jgi:hypothetical protein
LFRTPFQAFPTFGNGLSNKKYTTFKYSFIKQELTAYAESASCIQKISPVRRFLKSHQFHKNNVQFFHVQICPDL